MSETVPSKTKPVRADAQRNREHILDVAEEYFAEHGVNGSLDALAKQARVGTGTLYRHFPTREALLAALLGARDNALVVRRDSIRSESVDSADALEHWLGALSDWAGAFDGLPEPLKAATTGRSPLTVTCEGFITDTAAFLEAAQNDGRARQNVRARDLFLTALAISWASGAAMADERSAEALTALTRAGWETP